MLYIVYKWLNFAWYHLKFPSPQLLTNASDSDDPEVFAGLYTAGKIPGSPAETCASYEESACLGVESVGGWWGGGPRKTNGWEPFNKASIFGIPAVSFWGMYGTWIFWDFGT